ncbi:FAD binding domain-containing protein [Stagonosporopsis vannaccii]|nr:FAD binding domain-containing protein [Stagonosporopsis vannaccii]
MKQAIFLLLFFCTFETIAHTADTAKACVTLYLSLPRQVFFANSSSYEDSVSSYAYVGTRLRPTCLARPKTTNDVAIITKTMGKFPSVGFAVRGGGHNTNIGFAGINDGVTIDLRDMSAVQLQQSAGIVSVGAGARWQVVYDALDPYQLSVQGGRNGAVGVGGFLTGGGISFFSTQKGWACDSVVNFEVVLSSGTIINANATSRVDLFTALKGGLNNFGIITRFDLQTFSQGPMWGGAIIFSNSTDNELLDALVSLKAPGKSDPHVMYDFGFVYKAADRSFGAQIAMYHSQPDNGSASTLQAFADIQPQIYSSIRTGTPGSFAGEGEMLSAIMQSYYMHWATTTFSITPGILPRLHESFRQTSLALTDEYARAKLTIAISIQSVPPAAPLYNPNSLGFSLASHPEDDLLNIGIAFQYEDPTATDGLQEAIKTFTGELDRIAEEAGARDEHIYLNYAGGWQDVFAGYGNESLERMRRVALKYDRVGMFQKQVRGGFKLWK